MIEIMAKEGQDLDLGKRGENLARRVVFDISGWIKTFGEGSVHLLHQRNGDKTPYPCVVEVEKTKAYWPVTNTDVAMAGRGHAEIQYRIDDIVVKSVTYNTRVSQSMGAAGDTPPAPAENWLNTMLKLGEETTENAESAAESAEAAAASAESAAQSATNAATSEDNAKLSEDNAKNSETTAVSSAEAAALSAENSLASAESAATSEGNALASAESAKTDADRAEAARDSIVLDEEKMAQAVESAAQSESNAAASATAAKSSETNAAESETNAKASETAAATAKIAAESAQKAAEKARDDAQAIAGGDFASIVYVDEKAAETEENANAYTDQQMESKVSTGGDTMTGTLKMQPESADGYATIYKNANATGDYGLQMIDADADGNFMGLTLSANLQKLELKKKRADEDEYHFPKLYDTDTPPTAYEVGALPIEGGILQGNIQVSNDYAALKLAATESHHTELMKNADGTNDHGTILRDTNGDAVAELKLSAANGNVKLAKDSKEYTLYHEGNLTHLSDTSNPHEVTAAQVGAQPAITASGILKGNGAGGVTAATAGTDYVLPSGSITGNAATATKLATSRTIRTNLASTSAVNFNGTGNVTPGVTGTLPVANGGTGATTAAAARTNLGAAATITYTATVTASWTASGSYYYQTITVSGILATDNPIVDIKCGSDNAANVVYSENMGKVFRITTAANSITVWATEAISSAFPIQLKVVR